MIPGYAADTFEMMRMCLHMVSCILIRGLCNQSHKPRSPPACSLDVDGMPAGRSALGADGGGAAVADVLLPFAVAPFSAELRTASGESGPPAALPPPLPLLPLSCPTAASASEMELRSASFSERSDSRDCLEGSPPFPVAATGWSPWRCDSAGMHAD